MMTAKDTADNLLIPIKEFTPAKQTKLFSNLKQSLVSGKLLMTCPQEKEWTFYLHLGDIVYATGGNHSVRRWLRNIAIVLPEKYKDFSKLQREIDAAALDKFERCWEYELLCSWVKQGKITSEQVNQAIFSMVVEILFDITRGMEVTCQLRQDSFLFKEFDVIQPKAAIAKAEKMWAAWQKAKIGNCCPDLAPIIQQPEQLQQQTSEQVYRTLSELLDGQNTLRDLAVHLQREPMQVICSLMPYVQSGVVGLTEVTDFPKPYSTEVTKNLEQQNRPLVACVDDSPMTCYVLKQVITGAGYRFAEIHDPLKSITTLLQLKPDFIFLDVVMSDINGYEVCAQLRKHPDFRQTPIVFLTGSDGIIDRVKAMFVGSSDFLSKTVDADKIVSMIRKHLKN